MFSCAPRSRLGATRSNNYGFAAAGGRVAGQILVTLVDRSAAEGRDTASRRSAATRGYAVRRQDHDVPQVTGGVKVSGVLARAACPDLTGKVVIVTGASRGIGATAARA